MLFTSLRESNHLFWKSSNVKFRKFKVSENIPKKKRERERERERESVW